MEPLIFGGIALAGLVLLIILWKILQITFRVAIIAAVAYFVYQFGAPYMGWEPLPWFFSLDS